VNGGRSNVAGNCLLCLHSIRLNYSFPLVKTFLVKLSEAESSAAHVYVSTEITEY
jgi:hypothetical protein